MGLQKRSLFLYCVHLCTRNENLWSISEYCSGSVSSSTSSNHNNDKTTQLVTTMTYLLKKTYRKENGNRTCIRPFELHL